MAINTQKFLPQGKKGGKLTVLPKATLAPVKPSSSDITKVEGVEESPILVIKTKLIKIEDILKGTLAAEKKAADDKRKAEEQQEREEAENEVEGDPKTGVKFKLPLPGKIKSWWGNIKKFFFTVLFGWLFLKFMKWLPKLKGILKLLAGLAEFLIDFGGRILNGLVTFVHWGYKAFEWTRGAIENVFGEKGVKTFDKITSVLKTVLNWQLSLTLAMIAFSKEFSGGMEGWARNFMSIFKHGVGRSFKRLVIKMFGKKMGGTILTKLGIKTAATTTTATTATTATATTATTATGASTAGGVAGVGVVGTTAIVTGAGLLASGLGEGMFQLKKRSQWKEAISYEKFKDKRWWNPMKYFWGAVHLTDKFNSYLLGTIGVILDIVGAPFRYLIELIRYPFLDAKGKAKQRTNLAKFDARIREQFRETINAFSLGFLAKEKGSFGSMFGKKGTDAMGYTKDGETKKGSKHVTKTDLTGKMGLGGPVGETFGGKGGSTYDGNSNNISATDSSSKKIDGIVSSGYSDDGEEIYVINNKSSSKLLNNSNKEEKVIALGGGGGSSSDAFASNYRQG